MDNYRRTISSEEQIGEALMRVSNTLEAQRLTKSLEFQEKARRRTRLRFVISIVLLVLLLVSLIVLALFVFVLFKYLNPFLQRFIPFASSIFDDFGTIWDSLVASSTYMPVFLEQFSRLNEELITLLKNVNTLDLKGMVTNLNNLLASTNGLLITTNGMLKGLSSMMGQMNDTLVPMLKSMASMLTTLNSAMTPMLAGFANGASKVDWSKMVTDGAGMMSGLVSTGTQFSTLASGMMTSLSSAFDATTMANLTKAFQQMATNLPGTLTNIDGTINHGTATLNSMLKALDDANTANPGAMDKIIKNTVSTTQNLSDAMAGLSAAMGALGKVIGAITNPFGG